MPNWLVITSGAIVILGCLCLAFIRPPKAEDRFEDYP
jgi:hypothetical protein